MRRKHYARLVEDISKGLVDRDIVKLLLTINQSPYIVTASSCSGRVVVIAAPKPHDKKGSVFLFKKHEKIEERELLEVMERVEEARLSGKPFVWLSVQPLILHMYTCGYSIASRIISFFETLGFKYSCIKPSRIENVYYVMVSGTERLDIPLSLVQKTSIGAIVELVNTYLSFTKMKLEKIYSSIYGLILPLLEPSEEAQRD